MKVAIVVQRYGETINGGAELHARYIAEHLARHIQVEVLTTCAADYVTWRNELPAGVEQVNGISVRRFPVSHEREPLTFGEQSRRVFDQRHSVEDELRWLDAEGPASRALVKHINRHASEFDYYIFFSYRYYHAFHGARAAVSKAILVPTAERDPAIGLSIFPPVFRGVRALMYNSPEERAMIQALADNRQVPSVVVGIGSDVPPNPQPARFRQKFNLRGPFAVYVGRIDENKGCRELFEFFQAYLREAGGQLSLALIGNSLLPIPNHPRIRHLGFLDDSDKFDAVAASELLIMPSYLESLSMVALEAWALGKPVLANGACDVLRGQSIRSSAGLYYDGCSEFVETLHTIEQNRWLSGTLGKNGRQFFREHYAWPVIERKYLDMLERLSLESPRAAIEPLPGWFARGRQTCPPGADVLAALPSGPYLRFEPPLDPRPLSAVLQPVAQQRSTEESLRPLEPPAAPPYRNRPSFPRRHARQHGRGGAPRGGRR